MPLLQTYSHRFILLYLLTYFAYGMQFSIIGPLIPFLAESANKSITQFMFIFSIRGIAYILSGVMQKLVLKNFKSHKKILLSVLSIGITFILTALTQNLFYIGVLSFIFSFSDGLIQILITAKLIIVAGQQKKYWLSALTLSFIIGSSIAPLLISLAGLKILILIGVMFLIIVIFYLLPYFAQQQKKQSNQLNEKLHPQIQIQKQQSMPSNIRIYYFGIFFCYSSFTLSYRSLIPTYAVLSDTMSKQNAALVISAYNLSRTIFLIFFMHIEYDLIKGLKKLHFIGIITLVFCILAPAVNLEAYMIVLSSIVFGIIFSPFYPLLFSIPGIFGIKLSSQDTSIILISYSIGQTTVCALIGYGMQLFTPQFLFYSIFLIAILLKELSDYSIRLMQKYKDNLTIQQKNKIKKSKHQGVMSEELSARSSRM